MQFSISNNYLFLPTTQAIWDCMTKTYSKRGNKSRMYDLHQKVSKLRQGDQSLAYYYLTLCSLWEEIDFYDDFKAQCTEDTTLYNQKVEETRIFEFLAGLHLDYEPIRVLILGKDPLPSLYEVFTHLSQEEDRRHLMVQPQQFVVNHSTLVTTSHRGGRGFFHCCSGGGYGVAPQEDSVKLKCEHCGCFRHTKETSWDLHGHPQ